MKVKKILAALLILLFLILIFYTLFIPITVQKTVQVHLPAFRTTEQFAEPENLAKWFPPFSDAVTSPGLQIDKENKKLRVGDDSVQIKNLSIYSSLLTIFSGQDQKQFLLSVLPDTASSSASLMTLSYKTTSFKKWFKTK